MSYAKLSTSVKIKSYKVGKAGGRGIKVGLPLVWIDDLGLKPGDRVDLYRDIDDRLIIVKAGEPISKDAAAIYEGKTQIDIGAMQ